MAKRYIYALALEHNNYYIGTTKNPTRRWQEHIGAGKFTGSKWTKKYPPISQLFCISNGSRRKENIITIAFMLLFGPNNVRGGCYCHIEYQTPPRLYQHCIDQLFDTKTLDIKQIYDTCEAIEIFFNDGDINLLQTMLNKCARKLII